MLSKRPRQTSPPTSSSSSPSPTPTPKASRIAKSSSASSGDTGHPLLCTLPPTCHHHPTPIANSKDLESHYATYHAHVCEEKGCGCVFPEARLLELHQTECHDPLAAIRKERGEKIFACHLTTCHKIFATPKARRLHLIQVHGYPKEYFFAVTNKGVGGLLRKWGEGASLIRGPWKKRETKTREEQDENEEVQPIVEDTEDEEMSTESANAFETREQTDDVAFDKANDDQDEDVSGNTPSDNSVDALASSMNSLTLVPSSIRFGRGGKAAGFSQRPTPYEGTTTAPTRENWSARRPRPDVHQGDGRTLRGGLPENLSANDSNKSSGNGGPVMNVDSETSAVSAMVPPRGNRSARHLASGVHHKNSHVPAGGRASEQLNDLRKSDRTGDSGMNVDLAGPSIPEQMVRGRGRGVRGGILHVERGYPRGGRAAIRRGFPPRGRGNVSRGL